MKPSYIHFYTKECQIFHRSQCSINVTYPPNHHQHYSPTTSPQKMYQRRRESSPGEALQALPRREWSLDINYGTILILNNINNPLVQGTTMLASHCPPSPLSFHKIHFSLSRRVRFGQGVFVCGSTVELGLWDPSRAYRLKWTENDLWTGCLLLRDDTPERVEYKYIITDWNDPGKAGTEWEIGSHNRSLDLSIPRTTVVCDDRWNMDRVTLTLTAGRSRSPLQQKYYVVGDIAELGGWNEKKLMKRVRRSTVPVRKDSLPRRDRDCGGQEVDHFTFTFYTYRTRPQFYYYYIRKASTIQSQRRPGRSFNFANQHAPHPYRTKVTHPRGEINILDECNINQLVFSQVTPQIFVGSYPKSAADMQRLKENNITAILSIQSQRDFKSHGLTPHYVTLLCQQYGLKYRRYSILDMNNDDFVSKAEGGVRLMRELLRDGERVYVHCSAGIYRSPQMIALYLTLFQRYSLEQAVAAVKDNHPYAKPNSKVVKDAAGLIQFRRNCKAVLA